MSAPGFASAGDFGTESERLHLAERFHESGVSTQRFVDVEDGEKRTFDHTQRAPDDPALSGNYGIYAGRGGDDSGIWLVELDVDDYDEDGIDPDGLEAVEAISAETLAIESPHTSEENPGHRLVAVTDEDGEYVNVADALKREFGVFNPAPTWGEVRVKNQMTVGPGSKIDPGEYGCDKDWCEECTEPYGGYYRIARNEAITTVTIGELVDTIRADANYVDTESNGDQSSQQGSTTETTDGETKLVDCAAIEDRDEATLTNEAGLTLNDLRERDGEEQLNALLRDLNPVEYEYPSRSEADLATASLLWQRGFDPEDVARILRQFRRYSKTQRDDYLARTISKATNNDRRAFDFTEKYRPCDEETTTVARTRIALTVDGRTPFDCWRTVANDDGFRQVFLYSLSDLVGGIPDNDRVDALRDQEVTAQNGVFAEVCTSLARARKPEPAEDVEPDPKWRWQYWDALRVLRQFGANTPSALGAHLPLRAVRDGPLAVFRAADERAPVIDATITEAFRDQRADQRREICWLLSAIEESCEPDVAFETEELRDWFQSAHREYRSTVGLGENEPSVREDVAQHGGDPSSGEVAEQVRTDSLVRTHWRLLALLDEAQGGEATYHDLYNDDRLPISKERVRGLLADLRDSGLVRTDGPRDQRRASLTPTGEQALDIHDAEIGRESTLNTFERKTGETGEGPPNSFRRIRVSPDTSPPRHRHDL